MRRLALLILPLAFATACGNSKTVTPVASGSSSPEHIQIGITDAIVRGRLAVSGSSVSVAIKDNYFVPNILTAPAGATVTFVLKNEGAGLHNFSVTEQKITHDFAAGTSASITVKVPASGRLIFFCSYHRSESGMVGAIDVS